MFKKSKSDSKSYGIIGLGRFGSALAVELAKAGAEPLVIDGNEEKVREMREYTENAFVVSSFDKKTLSETGIQNCDIVVVCIGEKMDISILTTLNVVALGVPTVISKAANAVFTVKDGGGKKVFAEQGEILKKLGAEVVYPERDMAVRLAHKLETPNMLDFVQLSRKLNLLKLEVPRKIVGMTIMSADMRGRFGVNIIAIENNGNLTDNVHPDYMFREGDILYAVVSETQETKNGNTVNVRYCLYDNGSKTDADGNSCEELVLEKVYPDGNYETELVDFYLVNADTMQVTDEQKNTW